MNNVSDEPTTLPFAPAAERNRAPIGEVLATVLPERARVIEIGAGTGQHAVAFSRALPIASWLATDQEPAIPGLRARIRAEGPPGMPEPLPLDVTTGPWPAGPFDAAFTANTCHIMNWEAVCAMLAGVSQILAPAGIFLVYGPFMRDGRHTSDGNARFHRELGRQNPEQGLRALEALESEALRHQLVLEQVFSMPANNLTLLFRSHD